MSRDPKGQTRDRDPNTLRAQYIENTWICCTVGYPGDSLASCHADDVMAVPDVLLVRYDTIQEFNVD